jgi:ribulose 1,5-bisphosphate synthetase/thiazole synthase
MINPVKLTFLVFIAWGEAMPEPRIQRKHTDLLESYDFVIAGGGTAGLTVADRLSEAFPESTVYNL